MPPLTSASADLHLQALQGSLGVAVVNDDDDDGGDGSIISTVAVSSSRSTDDGAAGKNLEAAPEPSTAIAITAAAAVVNTCTCVWDGIHVHQYMPHPYGLSEVAEACLRGGEMPRCTILPPPLLPGPLSLHANQQDPKQITATDYC